MNIESLRLKRALRAALLVLLLGAAGMGKGYAQNFTVGDLKYSVNSDGTTVTVTGLKDVTFTGPLVIPESVTYNGVAYPVTTIGQHAFAWYDGFTGNLTIPNSVITICDWAFSGSGFTGNLIIGNSVTTIGDWAFYDCGFIGNLTIPNSVTTIGEIAFSHCSGLTSLIIGNSVTTIGYGAFTHCSGLTTVTFGYTVSEIGQGAFSSCDGLTAVYYTGSIAQWCGIIFVDSGANPLNNGSSLYINGTIVTDLVIPYGVTIIMPYAFCGGSFTGTLTIPNSVTYIGERAFWKCSSLTGSLTIPNSVTTIGNSAFSHCNGFAGSLTIPNSVTTIGSSAFSNCSGFIGDLTIPNSVTTIESSTFYRCSGLTSISIPNSVTSIVSNAFTNTGWYDAQPTGSILYLCNWCLGYKDQQPTGSLALNGSTKGIANRAFYGCGELTSVSIPNSVVCFGLDVFNDCSGLKEITFNAKDCIYDIWSGCTEVTTVVLGDYVENVKEKMFYEFGNLTTVTIGKSVRSIGSMAFANNPRLNMVYYNVEKDLIAPEPYSANDNSNTAFYNCPNLTTIHIGADVQEIGSNIFKGCNTVHFVVALGPTPAILDAGAFSDIVDNSILMVSCGKRVTYYSVWNMFPFNNIIEDCDTYGINVGAVGNGGTITPSVIVAQMGQEVQITITPNPGMVLVSIKVVNANDPTQIIPISPNGKAASTYSFTMPPFEVVVMATFATANTAVEENITVSIPASVYPNPTTGFVKVEAENIKHITISNTLGQQIFNGKASGNEFEYDFSGQKAGIYLVRIETASGVAVKKVSVTR